MNYAFLVILLKLEQIKAFCLHLLIHDNFKMTKGIRYSIAYYIHLDFINKIKIIKIIML